MDPTNPYQPPLPVKGHDYPPGADSSWRRPAALDFTWAFSFPFSMPNALLTLLIGAAAQFVPIVGPMTFLGYAYDTIERLHLGRDAASLDFDFNRLGQYLMRGLWVFLVALIGGFVFVPVMLVAMYAPLIIGGIIAASVGGDAGAVIMIVAFIVMFVLFFAAQTALLTLISPLMLRAGLTQDFAQAIDIGFLRDYLGRVFWQAVGVQVVMLFISPIFMLAGFFVLCVGAYLAVAAVMLMQAHLQWQLYEIYLARGGEKIGLKPESPAMPPVRDYRG
jgi:hypothetical protein